MKEDKTFEYKPLWKSTRHQWIAIFLLVIVGLLVKGFIGEGTFGEILQVLAFAAVGGEAAVKFAAAVRGRSNDD